MHFFDRLKKAGLLVWLSISVYAVFFKEFCAARVVHIFNGLRDSVIWAKYNDKIGPFNCTICAALYAGVVIYMQWKWGLKSGTALQSSD